MASGWVPEAARLYWVALWAGLLGWLLGRSRLRGWVAWLLAATVGALYCVQFAGKLWPSAQTMWGDLRWLASDLWRWARYGGALVRAPLFWRLALTRKRAGPAGE